MRMLVLMAAIVSTGLQYTDVNAEGVRREDVVKQFLKEHEINVGQVEHWKELKPSTGLAYRGGNSVSFFLDKDSVASGVIEFPRLNNTLKRVFQARTSGESQLTFRQTPTRWMIDLKKLDQDQSPLIVILELESPPYLALTPHVNRMDDRQMVRMPAHHAIVHGEKLQFEPLPHKNTIGYWVNVEDWAEWKFAVAKPGKYDIHVFQGCGKGQGGSDVDIVIGEQRVPFQVVDTGHFQNFRWRMLGTVELTGDEVQSLEVRPRKIARNAVMDIREIRLVPTGTPLERETKE